MGLGTLRIPPDTARTDGNQRLVDLVSGTLTVGLRVHEAGKTVALIGLQGMPRQRQQQGRRYGHYGRLLEADPTQEKSDNCDRQVSETGAQVALQPENIRALHWSAAVPYLGFGLLLG